MASITRRTEARDGIRWVVNYRDVENRQRRKTFRVRRDALMFKHLVEHARNRAIEAEEVATYVREQVVPNFTPEQQRRFRDALFAPHQVALNNLASDDDTDETEH